MKGLVKTKTIVEKVAHNRRWLPALSSLFTGLGFLNTHLGGLVLVSLLPFIYYGLQAKDFSRKQILLDCWLGALVFSLITWSWTLQTVPGTWLDLHGGVSVVVKAIMWLIIAVISSLGFGLIMGFYVSHAKKEPVRLLVFLPFTWAVAELVRSYSLAVFALGPGSTVSPNWNFGSLGLAISSTPLLYASRFVGLYGLSAVAVAVNLTIYLFIVKRYKNALAITIMIVLLSLLAWGLYLPKSNQTINVAAVYLHDAGGSLNTWDNVTLPTKDTAVLVLPEYSHFFENPGYPDIARSNFGPKTIIVTTQVGSGHPPMNNLLYYSNQTGFISSQSKTFLAPYGEYMSYTTIALLKAFGQQSVLASFQQNSQVRQGNQPEHAIRVNGLTVGGLACSGVLNLNEYRKLAQQGAEVLTNSASLSLLNTASLYRVQEFYQNRFHAVANAKPFVQASRSGAAYIITSDGKVIARADDRTRLIEAKVALQQKRTLYSLLP